MIKQKWFNILVVVALVWQTAVVWYENSLQKVCPLGRVVLVGEKFEFAHLTFYRISSDSVNVRNNGYYQGTWEFDTKTLEGEGKYQFMNMKLTKNPNPLGKPLLCVYQTTLEP